MMNNPAPIEAVTVPSLENAESLRLAQIMVECAKAMAATDGIDDFGATGWLPDTFFDALAQLYIAYDAYIEHNIAASELKIMCKLGCARCCQQHVYSTYAFEIINLYRQIRARSDYVDRFRGLHANAQEFQTMFASYMERVHAREDLAVVNTLQHLAALAKPCPLLAGNRCSVYADRPVSCRMYHSLTSPVLCTTVVGRTFHLVPPDGVSTILAEVNDRLLFPYCEYLAQGFVVFASQREHRPWGTDVSRATLTDQYRNLC